MELVWSNKKLEKIYNDDQYNPKGYHPRVIDGFVDTLSFMEWKATTQDIRALERLHYEKLKPPYQNNEHSVRIGVGGWRIIFIPLEDGQVHILDIQNLENHIYKPKK